MKSPSAKLYDLGAESAAVAAEILNRCHHPQAEPVILSTGEQVACVCIGCYEPLPADYIERQAEVAHLRAYCRHSGTEFVQSTCRVCGDEVSLGTWPNLRR